MLVIGIIPESSLNLSFLITSNGYKMKTLLLTGHKIICLSLILFFSSNIRAASTDHINFRKLSVNEGLSQNTVWGMMQDANNKIWIGTTDGLNRYDG